MILHRKRMEILSNYFGTVTLRILWTVLSPHPNWSPHVVIDVHIA